MQRRSIYFLSLLVLMLLFCLPAPFSGWIARAQAQQELGLRLVGTAVTHDPTKNFAIIEVQTTGNQRAYREGDRVGDLLIKKVLPDYVVLGTKVGDQMLFIGHGGSGGSNESSPQMARLDRKEIDSVLPDYMQLIQEIRVRPHFEAGQPAGFLIYNIEPGSIFSRMGLENGDAIKAVNGRPVATTQEAIDFYDALKTGTTVSLKIQRGESTQELNFVIHKK